MTGGTGSERVGPMLDPPRPGEVVRENMDEAGWTVTEAAACLKCARDTLSRLARGQPIPECACRPAMSSRRREGATNGGRRQEGRPMRSRSSVASSPCTPTKIHRRTGMPPGTRMATGTATDRADAFAPHRAGVSTGSIAGTERHTITLPVQTGV